MQPHGCVHIRIFILHAAIVPTCVGLHAASSMAHWCQLFPVLVYAARACCNRLARWWQGLYAGDGALLVCMCVLLVWHSLAKPACSMQVFVTGVCMCTFVYRCPWDPWSCVLPTLFTQVRYLPYHACSSCGRGWFCHTRVCSWSCVPLLCVFVCGWGVDAPMLCSLSPPCSCSIRIHAHGVALQCAMCSALPDARICTLDANVCVVAGATT
jgi:hypothetical protein